VHQSRDETVSGWNPLLLGAAAVVGVVAGALLGKSGRPTRFSFRNKTVVITGGSRGLGLELARVFAREGANLALLARNASTLEAARNELEKFAPHVLTIACDVRKQQEVERAVQHTVRTFGRIDVLVNNAGVMQVGPFESMTMEDYLNAMDTHAWASLYSILAAVPHMKANGGGRIVNIVSIGGKIAVPHMAPYVMSKFAQAGLSEALSTELSREKIFVTSVYPGLMRTGSHVNARFKGKNRQEFAWFSIGAGMPLLSINAARAAQQIVEACRRGLDTLVLTPAARAATVAKTLSPSLVIRSLRAVNRLLPRETSDTRSQSGWQSRSAWSPSPLTALADRVVERNNEHRAVG